MEDNVGFWEAQFAWQVARDVLCISSFSFPPICGSIESIQSTVILVYFAWITNYGTK
jgi:hypothetical protein